MQDQFSNLNNLSSIVNSSSKRVLRLPTDSVVSKIQVRKDFSDESIDALANTIIEFGQDSPITVTPLNKETGKYTILTGERRWRACKEAGIDIDVIVKNDYDPENELHNTLAELVENVQREDLNAFELGTAYISLKEKFNITGKSIANSLGVSERHVSVHVTLIESQDYIKEIFKKGITSDLDILTSLRTLDKKDRGFCKTLCKKAETDGITRAEVKHHLSQYKDNLREEDSPIKTPTINVSDYIDKTGGELPIIKELKNEITSSDKGYASNNDDDDNRDNVESTNSSSVYSFMEEHQEDSSNEAPKDAEYEPNAIIEDDQPVEQKLTLPYKKCKADHLNITVKYSVDGSIMTGFLCMDRVSFTDSKVWIRYAIGKEFDTKEILTKQILSITVQSVS